MSFAERVQRYAGEYPEPAYTGGDGEATAWMRRHDEPRTLEHSNGGGAHYLATGAQTGGHLGLYRWDMGPVPSGPEPHFHRGITESFFVLSGQVRLHDGNDWVEASAGDFMFVPEGGIHGFRNESGEDASMLILFTPGAPREDYFETLADAARREAMDADAWREFYLRHDTFWV
jgi:mannose-6-phosphate isomerase-like protein (cupin superfamily)